MAMTRQNSSAVLVPHLTQAGAFDQSPFHLFDVGVSGGIDDIWRGFAPHLRVWGFDPLLAEIERLNAQAGPGEVYEAAFIGCSQNPEHDWDAPEFKNNQSFPRTSAPWAQQALAMDWVREAYNGNSDVRYAGLRISLDAYAAANDITRMDFLKVDTDGGDMMVLAGARGLLRDGAVLGAQVEAQFHGAHHPDANTFANIDILLRGAGFSLFDMDMWRYSRACLPRPFYYDLPGQTTRGQVAWGEALYLRDLGDPEYERKWPDLAITPALVLKSAALFDLFSLQDCAVEVLLKYSGLLSAAGWDAAALIDMMVPMVDGRAVGRDAFVTHCETLVRQRRFKAIPF